MPEFFFLIIWAAFCDTIAKTRLFGVSLSLHSFAPLRNRPATDGGDLNISEFCKNSQSIFVHGCTEIDGAAPTILAAGKLEIHAIISPQSDNPHEVLYITFFRFAVRSFL